MGKEGGGVAAVGKPQQNWRQSESLSSLYR